MKRKINNKEMVENQYKDDAGLLIRKNLHKRYSTNKQGFGNWLFDIMDVKGTVKILELGSGNGDYWRSNYEALSSSSHLTLSDFSSGMVDTMRKKFTEKNVDIKQIDIQDIPFEDETYDIVIANAMLYHIPELDKALAEVKRVLKPSGKFYSSTFGVNGLGEFIHDTLNSLDIETSKNANYTFTLQNGADYLRHHFQDVNRMDYEDMLKVTEAKDLVDYIFSMTSMNGLEDSDREIVQLHFEKMIAKDGSINIPKEYGSFISVK